MGCFTLCVETTAREVNALLELHNVHPQVRGDVKKQLNALIDKAYEHQHTTSPGYKESSQQVCHAIASSIIDRALTIAIPRTELTIKEKENAALQQDIVDLKGKVEEAERRWKEAVDVLESFKTAHDYMLHSYFREVLILRHRIHDLEKRNRAKQSSGAITRTALPHPGVGGSSWGRRDSPSLSGAAMARPSATSMYCEQTSPTGESTSTFPSAAGAGETQRPQGQARQQHQQSVLGEMLVRVEEHSTRGTTPAVSAASTDTGGEGKGIAIHPAQPPQQPPPASAAAAAAVASAPSRAASLLDSTPIADGSPAPQQHSPPPSSPTFAPSSNALSSSKVSGGGAVCVPSHATDVTLLTAHEMLKAISHPLHADSVDAVFDYEEYVAMLNGSAGQSAMGRRLDGLRLMQSTGGATTLQQLAGMTGSGHSPRHGSPSAKRHSRDLLATGGKARLAMLEEELDFYKTKASKVRWCLEFAARPVKYQLSEQLRGIRDEVLAMQRCQQEFFVTMQDLVALLQSRSDALLEVLSLFTTEVLRLTDDMKKDASKKSCAELFLSSGQRKNALEAIFTVDKDSGKGGGLPAHRTGGGDGGGGADLTQYIHHRFTPWRNHAVTFKARKALAALESFAESARRRQAFLLAKGGDGAEQGYRKLFHRSDSSGNSGGGLVTWASSVESDEAKTTHAYSSDGEEGEASADRWRSAVVEGASDKHGDRTGQDLLREVVRLRLRRACSRVRRSHVVNRILGLECMRGNEGGAAEDDEAFQETRQVFVDVCQAYESSIQRDTRRIRELLSALALHMKQHGAALSNDMAELLSSQGGGILRNGADDFPYYASPYLYSPNGGDGSATRREQRGRANRILYVPVGTGAESYVVFQNEQLPLSSFAASGAGESARTYSETRTPYGAAVDYCIGVQRGMPVGDHFGPVYLKEEMDETQHGARGGDGHHYYYIADENGKDLLKEAEAATQRGFTTTAALRAEAGGSGTGSPVPIPMTQILVPAPMPFYQSEPSATAETACASNRHGDGAPPQRHPYAYHVAPAPSSSSAAAADSPSLLQPIYLVPLTTPATAQEQLHSGLGHTAASALFAVDEPGGPALFSSGAGIPIAVSYAHLLAPTGGSVAVGGDRCAAVPNPYLHDPPRVCRPPTEEAELLRIRSLSKPPAPLQTEAQAMPQPHNTERDSGSVPGDDDAGERDGKEGGDAVPTATSHSAGALSLPPVSPVDTATKGEPLGSPSSSTPPLTSPPATTPAPVALLASFESALQRAKQARNTRLEQESAQREGDGEGCKAASSLIRRAEHPTTSTAAWGTKDQFLRVRLPGSGVRLAPLKPSAHDTVQLQRKLRLPVVDAAAAAAVTASKAPPPSTTTTTTTSTATVSSVDTFPIKRREQQQQQDTLMEGKRGGMTI